MECFHSIVHKGMDHSLKIELIVNLQFLELMKGIKIKYRERSQEEDLEE